MSAPLYEHLLAYSKQNRISFAMPGHKNGRGLKKDLLSLDVTELSETENLIHPGEYVLKSTRAFCQAFTAVTKATYSQAVQHLQFSL